MSAELSLISPATAGRSVVILLHDVGWPCGYRDMYYEPERLDHPHPHGTGRFSPFDASVSDYGLPFDIPMALGEGGDGNSVQAAVDDFIAGADREWGYFRINRFWGLGVLWDRSTASDELGRLLDGLAEASTVLDGLFSNAELLRLMLLMRLHDSGDLWARQKAYIDKLEEKLGVSSPEEPSRVPPTDGIT